MIDLLIVSVYLAVSITAGFLFGVFVTDWSNSD